MRIVYKSCSFNRIRKGIFHAFVIYSKRLKEKEEIVANVRGYFTKKNKNILSCVEVYFEHKWFI